MYLRPVELHGVAAQLPPDHVDAEHEAELVEASARVAHVRLHPADQVVAGARVPGVREEAALKHKKRKEISIYS